MEKINVFSMKLKFKYKIKKNDLVFDKRVFHSQKLAWKEFFE